MTSDAESPYVVGVSIPLPPPEPPAVPAHGPAELQEGVHALLSRSRGMSSIAFNASVAAYTVLKVLRDTGLVEADALQEAFDETQAEMQERYEDLGLGVRLGVKTDDKDSLDPAKLPQIDCADRMELCRGACCTMWWALTPEEVEEGLVQFDIARPYMNRRRADDGYCVHNDAETHGCTIYEDRPVLCRTYDCRRDERIWLDFDGRVINPALFSRDPGERALPLVQIGRRAETAPAASPAEAAPVAAAAAV